MNRTIGTDPTSPTTEIGNNGEVSQGFGLTKREHMAIEFTKALLTGRILGDLGEHTIRFICKDAILITDKLIKELNKDENQ